MTQVASSSAQAPGGSSYSYTPSPSDASGSAFSQALQDAGYAGDQAADADAAYAEADDAGTQDAGGAEDGSDRADSVDRDGDEQGGGQPAGRKRKTDASSGLLGLFAGRPAVGLGLRGRVDGEGKGALGGLVGGGAGATVPQTGALETRAADLDAFADLLDQAAGQAALQPNQTFQLALGPQSLPVSGVEMARLPDGSLSMTLQADTQAVTEVRATLEALRRRLQARGVDVSDLSVQGEFSPDVQSRDTA